MANITVEIPGTFTEEEMCRISDARRDSKIEDNDLDHFVDRGIQTYLSFKDDPSILVRRFGPLPRKLEVTQENFKVLENLAGRVSLENLNSQTI